MRTDALIGVLAAEASPVAPKAVERFHAVAVGGGIVGAMLVMLGMLGLRSDLSAAVELPMFWVKIGFPLALAACAVAVTIRLSRPGARTGLTIVALAAPVVALWGYSAYVLVQAAADQRGAMIMGATWRTCPWNIAIVSLPALAAVLAAMRNLAPTRPALAGAAGGLLAGALGAAVYALHCPEMEAPFLATWYVLGILIPAGIGAALGRSLLRW